MKPSRVLMEDLDLSFLSAEEESSIRKVLLRDEDLKRLENGRVRRLRLTILDPKQLKVFTGQWFEELRSKRFGRHSDVSTVVRASMRRRRTPAPKSSHFIHEVHTEEGDNEKEEGNTPINPSADTRCHNPLYTNESKPGSTNKDIMGKYVVSSECPTSEEKLSVKTFIKDNSPSLLPMKTEQRGPFEEKDTIHGKESFTGISVFGPKSSCVPKDTTYSEPRRRKVSLPPALQRDRSFEENWVKISLEANEMMQPQGEISCISPTLKEVSTYQGGTEEMLSDSENDIQDQSDRDTGKDNESTQSTNNSSVVIEPRGCRISSQENLSSDPSQLSKDISLDRFSKGQFVVFEETPASGAHQLTKEHHDECPDKILETTISKPSYIQGHDRNILLEPSVEEPAVDEVAISSHDVASNLESSSPLNPSKVEAGEDTKQKSELCTDKRSESIFMCNTHYAGSGSPDLGKYVEKTNRQSPVSPSFEFEDQSIFLTALENTSTENKMHFTTDSALPPVSTVDTSYDGPTKTSTPVSRSDKNTDSDRFLQIKAGGCGINDTVSSHLSTEFVDKYSLDVTEEKKKMDQSDHLDNSSEDIKPCPPSSFTDQENYSISQIPTENRSEYVPLDHSQGVYLPKCITMENENQSQVYEEASDDVEAPPYEEMHVKEWPEEVSKSSVACISDSIDDDHLDSSFALTMSSPSMDEGASVLSITDFNKDKLSSSSNATKAEDDTDLADEALSINKSLEMDLTYRIHCVGIKKMINNSESDFDTHAADAQIFEQVAQINSNGAVSDHLQGSMDSSDSGDNYSKDFTAEEKSSSDSEPILLSYGATSTHQDADPGRLLETNTTGPAMDEQINIGIVDTSATTEMGPTGPEEPPNDSRFNMSNESGLETDRFATIEMAQKVPCREGALNVDWIDPEHHGDAASEPTQLSEETRREESVGLDVQTGHTQMSPDVSWPSEETHATEEYKVPYSGVADIHPKSPEHETHLSQMSMCGSGKDEIPSIVIMPSESKESTDLERLKQGTPGLETPIEGDNWEDEGVDSDDDSVSSYGSDLPGRRGLSNALSLSQRTGSLLSVYSDAGDFGNVTVQGAVEFAMMYSPIGELVIMVEQCQDLAIANARKQRTDPYVKTYLYPDKLRRSKRKTSIKKRTVNPVYVEALRYQINREDLATKTLNMSVWHNDSRGRNVFLGQIEIDLKAWDWRHEDLTWYNLLPKNLDSQESQEYHGVLSLSLKYVPSESTGASKHSTGEIHIWLREARELRNLKSQGIDSFVKCYMLPDTSKKSRQKTRVVKKSQNPVYNHAMVYDGFRAGEVREACCELTVWDHNTLSNQFLGGVRLSLGTGRSYGKKVDWMDSVNEEVELWEKMLSSPNTWVEGELPLRCSMTSRK